MVSYQLLKIESLCGKQLEHLVKFDCDESNFVAIASRYSTMLQSVCASGRILCASSLPAAEPSSNGIKLGFMATPFDQLQGVIDQFMSSLDAPEVDTELEADEPFSVSNGRWSVARDDENRDKWLVLDPDGVALYHSIQDGPVQFNTRVEAQQEADRLNQRDFAKETS